MYSSCAKASSSSWFLMPNSWKFAFRCLHDNAKFGCIRNLSNAVRWPTNVEDDELVEACDSEDGADNDVEDEGLSLALVRFDGLSTTILVWVFGRLGGTDARRVRFDGLSTTILVWVLGRLGGTDARPVGHDRVDLRVATTLDVEGSESHSIVCFCG
ncbi:hypothetical protein NLI96_g11560 [Meripilus lineatus]|uniref:Uncharacterized protein n=1 Tax=Meripilus lineatus TaxID=2056292 RepID=A0AAD5YD76_9APHY|nr:hypothetical protein NLI96_g11560 [Physisporinus lineatus]